MQLAHDRPVGFGHLAEGALPQAELIPRPASHGLRGEPDLLQDGGEGRDGCGSGYPLVRGGLLGEVAAPFPADLRGSLAGSANVPAIRLVSISASNR